MKRRDMWLSTTEVAQLWGMSRKTVMRAIRSGRLPARRSAGGREWRVSYRDAVACLTAPEGIPVVPEPERRPGSTLSDLEQ